MIEGEANFHRHLPVINFIILDMSAHLGHLKPPHVANGFRGEADRIFNRVVN